jgi:Flp pilus assembly protein TadG
VRNQRSQRGAALVEFAVALPILMFLLVGIVSFGLILREYQVLQNGAREGARLSILPNYQIAMGLSTADQNARRDAIKQRVVDYLAAEQLTVAAGNVTVDQNAWIDMGGGLRASASKITVTYSRSLLLGNSWPFGPVSLRSELTFRNLY